jgi:hypothetical protein
LPVQSPKGQRVSAYTDMQRISSFTKDWNNLHHHLEVRREQRKRHLIRRRPITCICQQGYTHIYAPF